MFLERLPRIDLRVPSDTAMGTEVLCTYDLLFAPVGSVFCGNAHWGLVLTDMRFAEFFAGIGLVRVGLEKVGWKCAFANDLDPKKLNMYADQFEDWQRHYVLQDVHTLSSEQIPSVDLATASFPCTDLSLAGGRSGLSGRYSSAFWGFIGALKAMEHRPKLVMLENVTGFLSSHQGSDFRAALESLGALGYDVDAFVIDAVRFVPQSRQRLFVVGILRSRARHVRTLVGQELESGVRPRALAEFISSNPDLPWVIRKLPSLPSSTTTIRDVLESVPAESSEWWSETRVEYLLSQMSSLHRQVAKQMIESPLTSYGTIFRRVRNGKSMAELRVDGIAGCLRTPKGGSGRQILFVAGMNQRRARLINGRECARLMGADDFPISGSLNQTLYGFGDAVCVPVISWIGENYLNPALEEIRSHQYTAAEA